ncbi:MAG: hypothetical protein ABIJ97_16505 [Bacteroidota bacterium]
MKFNFILLVTICSFNVPFYTFADSPITSTQFSVAYRNEGIVKTASESNGILTDELMEYLTNTRNPVDVKMAVINELSWNIDGKSNADRFLDYVMKNKNYADENVFIKKGEGDELLCLAYLKAMDNYFDVSDAYKYAQYALKKKPKSYTFNIITAIIKAQKEFDTNWCNVYKATDKVRNNSRLKKDMNKEAIAIIFEYMDLYNDSCK